jgi:hypothetical protein
MPRLRFSACLLTGATVAIAACTTETIESSDGRPLPPRPVAAPAAPSDAKATTIAFMLGPKPLDTNGNGWPDLVQIEAYLFAEPHPTPIVEPGAFVFNLFAPHGAADPAASPLMSWRIEGEVLQKSRAISLAGACWRLELVIPAEMESRLPRVADLAARFEPADARPPVKASSVRSIQLVPAS